MSAAVSFASKPRRASADSTRSMLLRSGRVTRRSSSAVSSAQLAHCAASPLRNASHSSSCHWAAFSKAAWRLKSGSRRLGTLSLSSSPHCRHGRHPLSAHVLAAHAPARSTGPLRAGGYSLYMLTTSHFFGYAKDFSTSSDIHPMKRRRTVASRLS